MLQLDDMSPRFRENPGGCSSFYFGYYTPQGQQVANPSGSRRYRNRDVASHMDVASQPVCDVAESIPDIARTNNKPLRCRRISAFLPPASCGVSGGGHL